MITETQVEASLEDRPLAPAKNYHRPFNIFEALGATNSELKHSNFLAYLLDPANSHGLGDRFLRSFLSHSSLTEGGFDLKDLGHVSVKREPDGIDILILNPTSKWVVVIENKWKSGESRDQLFRYFNTIETTYPEWTKSYLFLDLLERVPSHESYVPISYKQIAELLEAIITDETLLLSFEVKFAVAQYCDLINRKVASLKKLESSEFQILRERIIEWISCQPDLHVSYQSPSKDVIQFGPIEWKSSDILCNDKSLYRSVFAFEVSTYSTPTLRVQINPGPRLTRTKLWDSSQNHGPPFNQGKWSNAQSCIFKQNLGNAEQWSEAAGDPNKYNSMIATVIELIQASIYLHLPPIKRIAIAALSTSRP